MQISDTHLEKINKLARQYKKGYMALFRKLRVIRSDTLDTLVNSLHEEVFAEINCLECGNCCKKLGPQLGRTDISRMAKAMRMKISEFERTYTKIDEDGDFVFNSLPCPFIQKDNYCMIYENRPRACREFPHTQQKKIYQILDKTLLNISVCPAVFEIACQLKKKIN